MIAFTMSAWVAAVAGSVFAGGASSGLVVLNSTADGALSMTGNSKVLIPAKVVYVNSSSPSAVKTVGTALLDVPHLYIVGGASFGGESKCTGTVTQSSVVYVDPLTNLQFPLVTTLTDLGAKSMKGSSPETLSPGYYSGGVSLTGNAAVTMAPGVYVIGGSGLKVTSGSITGEGVTLIMQQGALNIAGASSLNLSPPESGSFAGVVIAQPVANTEAMSLAGGSGVNISGTIYAPSALLSLVGNSTVAGEGPQMGDLVIANKVSLKGTGEIRIGHASSVAIKLQSDSKFD
jgi:hypothetical protein